MKWILYRKSNCKSEYSIHFFKTRMSWDSYAANIQRKVQNLRNNQTAVLIINSNFLHLIHPLRTHYQASSSDSSKVTMVTNRGADVPAQQQISSRLYTIEKLILKRLHRKLISQTTGLRKLSIRIKRVERSNDYRKKYKICWLLGRNETEYVIHIRHSHTSFAIRIRHWSYE